MTKQGLVSSRGLDICHADEAASTQMKLISATIQRTTTNTDDKEVELVKTQRRTANKSHPQAEPTKSTNVATVVGGTTLSKDVLPMESTVVNAAVEILLQKYTD